MLLCRERVNDNHDYSNKVNTEIQESNSYIHKHKLIKYYIIRLQ